MIAFHSDDFGYNPEVDKKIIKLIQEDKLSGISVISNLVKPQSLEKLSSIKDKTKTLKINLHVNLIEGKSLAKKEDVISLVNKKGYFYTKTVFFIRLLLGLINPDHIEQEVLKQLNLLDKKGIRIDSIDSHQHIHALSPIAEIVSEVALQNNIKYIRSYKHIIASTLRAKLIYLSLKIIAFLSHLRFYKKFGLSSSWKLDNTNPLVIMTWESKGMNIPSHTLKNITYVIHPYLGFDKNTSYENFFSKNK